ncbi:cysteine proteinase [Amylocystis lapponica]|nr:cysteine proteinase [Amylocystis lapponica]
MSAESPKDESALTPVKSPSPDARQLKMASLPDVDDAGPPLAGPNLLPEEDEFQSLTPIRMYELNQNLLDDTVPDRPLIAPLEPMATLRAEYEGGSLMFMKQIDWLVKSGFIGIRRTRGDGDCFYRSLAFAYIERLLFASDKLFAVTSAISALEASQPLLEEAGFQRLVFEDFYDCFVYLINKIITPGEDGMLLTPSTLLEAFNAPEVSNSIVVYLRLLTSAQIRADPGAYESFLMHPEMGEPMQIRDFCESFVEAVGKEADHVQMTALTQALKVNINVAYLDGRPHGSHDGTVDFVTFHNTDEENTEPVILLYRPGHYDILDSRSEDVFENIAT